MSRIWQVANRWRPCVVLVTNEVTPEVLPLSVAIRFSHAAVQYVADFKGIDVLHIKGPAVPDELLAVAGDEVPTQGGGPPRLLPRLSHDADVLVRPSQAWRLIEAMEEVGWSLKHRFDDDSVFGHAATMVHDSLGHLDVHRRLPGMDRDPEHAFDTLFKERAKRVIAEYECSVPSVAGHRLVLVLNAGRSGKGESHPDLARAWWRASAEEQAEVMRLARHLHADAALAAITGSVLYQPGGEFQLWRLLGRGEERSFRFLVALLKAQPGLKRRVRTARRLVRLKRKRSMTARNVRGGSVSTSRILRDAGAARHCVESRGCAGGRLAKVVALTYGAPEGLARVSLEPEYGLPFRLYLMRLPDGPPVCLQGVSGLIWVVAAEGEADVAGAVAAALVINTNDVRREVDSFLTHLVQQGLLMRRPDGADSIVEVSQISPDT